MRIDRSSSTARLIARCLRLAAGHPQLRALLPPGAEDGIDRILAQDAPGGWVDRLLTRPWAAGWAWSAERRILPGIVLHYLARKAWLERAVVEALEAGCDQVVVLGAGFDTLAWRLHGRWPKTWFCELDHPATQRPKAAALGASTGSNLAFLPVDLGRESPLDALRGRAAFDPARRTCVIAEGLLMYFPAPRVAALLRDLAELPCAQLALSFMATGDDGRAAFRGGRPTLIDAWLRMRGEPFAWSCPSSDLAGFLAPLGWRLTALADAFTLRREILRPVGLADAPLAEGEGLCLAASRPADAWPGAMP